MVTNTSLNPRIKISSVDLSLAGPILEAAAILMVPDGLTQRQAFKKLMPQIYYLRNTSYSFEQISKLLAHVGFKLQSSVVRNYYSQMLPQCIEICQSHMTEQFVLAAELRKHTQEIKISDVESLTMAVLDRQRKNIEKKLGAIFEDTPVVESVVKPAKTVTIPSTTSTVSAPDGVKPAGVWLCRPVPSEVKLLDRRDGVSDQVYLPGDLTHPAIPGVLLSLEQRLSSVALEFYNSDNGDIKQESADEKRFRVLWREPISPFVTRTQGDFTVMDHSLFKKR